MSKNARMRLAHLAREALQKTADGDWGQSPSARLNDKLIKSRQTGKKLIARHSRITVEFEIAPDGTNLKMINVFVCA